MMLTYRTPELTWEALRMTHGAALMTRETGKGRSGPKEGHGRLFMVAWGLVVSRMRGVKCDSD